MDAQRQAEEAARLKQEEELRQEQEKELARLAAEDALLRMEKESDAKIARLGANAACAEALSSMLAASVGVYRGIVEGLETMVTSIAAEPADIRLRLIRIRNEDFQERLGRQPGVWLFLRALGFQALSREDLPTDMVTMLNLSSSPPNERFLLLKEPDMMNAYEEWTQWHKRLLSVANFLQELGKLAFQRIAHLGRHGQDVAASEILLAKELLAAWENVIPSWQNMRLAACLFWSYFAHRASMKCMKFIKSHEIEPHDVKGLPLNICYSGYSFHALQSNWVEDMHVEPPPRWQRRHDAAHASEAAWIVDLTDKMTFLSSSRWIIDFTYWFDACCWCLLFSNFSKPANACDSLYFDALTSVLKPSCSAQEVLRLQWGIHSVQIQQTSWRSLWFNVHVIYKHNVYYQKRCIYRCFMYMHISTNNILKDAPLHSTQGMRTFPILWLSQ